MTDSDMAYGMAAPDGSPHQAVHSPWASARMRARTMLHALTQRVDRGGPR